MAKGTSAANFVKSFFEEINKKVTPDQLAVADEFFESLKKEVLSKVLSSDVSQELINHTNPSPILGTSGTLFGFLGLVEGQSVVPEILDIIDKTMTYSVSRRLVRGGIKISIKIPSLEDFRTPDLELPWEGGYSVVDAVEKGLSGLQNYIFKNSPSSRSMEGVQTKNPVRGTKFTRHPWISPILKEVKAQAKNFR
jgi:hypothetical protein